MAAESHLSTTALPMMGVSAWVEMWCLAFLIYTVCKGLAWQRVRVTAPSRGRQAAFLLAWPGMDASDFFRPRMAAAPPCSARADVLYGAMWAIVGASMFWYPPRRFADTQETLIAWCGMIGGVLMLHFGVFRLLAAFWRDRGYDVRPIMNAPLAATSVSDFWGRRWNTAFRDLTARCIFRPIARRYGSATATWASFLFSGIVHDVVISLPACAGYGQPTLYFLLQALAVQFEHSGLAERYLLRRPIMRRAFAFVAILAPVNLLFHAPFRQDVVIPFMEACGAR